jgi:hypothetical protein
MYVKNFEELPFSCGTMPVPNNEVPKVVREVPRFFFHPVITKFLCKN